MRFALIVLLATSSPALALAQSPSRSPLEMSVNGSMANALINILEMGSLPVDYSSEVVVTVRNKALQPLTLDAIATGANVDASWGNCNRDVHRLTLVPDATGELRIRVRFPSNSEQGYNVISLMRDDVAVTHIVLDYSLHPAELSFTFRTPELSSPIGKNWSKEYSIASGAAPIGYTIAGADFESGGSERACRIGGYIQYMTCRQVQANDDDVVYGFTILGFEADSQHNKDEAAHAFARLTVTYHLRTAEPPHFATELPHAR